MVVLSMCRRKKGQLATDFSSSLVYFFSGHTDGSILAINPASIAIVENSSMWEKSVLMIVSIFIIHSCEKKAKVFTNEN